MNLHDMLVWVLVLQAKGGDTTDVLKVALDHDTSQI